MTLRPKSIVAVGSILSYAWSALRHTVHFSFVPMVAMGEHDEQRQYRVTSIRIDGPIPMGESPRGILVDQSPAYIHSTIEE
jgi:hypothetical protein